MIRRDRQVYPLRAGVAAATFLWRTLRREWQGVIADPVRQLTRRGPSGLLLACVAAFGVIFFHDLAQRQAGAVAVRILGGVYGSLPLWLELLRTPVSLYVPALDLPVWAGITQLFLAFALAELALGRLRTLFIAYATTLAGTLTVRVMIAMGPGWWRLGLPPQTGQVLDTGPSAAVVGLFTYISVIRRAPIVFALTGGSMVWESIADPNLAGREHLIAVATAMILGLCHGRGRWWPALRARGASWRHPIGPAPRPAAALCGRPAVPTAPRAGAPRGAPAPAGQALGTPRAAASVPAPAPAAEAGGAALRPGGGASATSPAVRVDPRRDRDGRGDRDTG